GCDEASRPAFSVRSKSVCCQQYAPRRAWEGTVMLRHCFFYSPRVASPLLLAWWLVLALTPVWASNEVACTFDNADLQTVIKKVGEFTGTTFLFDPAQVQGKITILC